MDSTHESSSEPDAYVCCTLPVFIAPAAAAGIDLHVVWEFILCSMGGTLVGKRGVDCPSSRPADPFDWVRAPFLYFVFSAKPAYVAVSHAG